MNAGIYYLCEELVFQCVSAAVAPDDASYVPELQVIKECTMSYTYLTNEQLIYIAGGF